MKILFGTGNLAKLDVMRQRLADLNRKPAAEKNLAEKTFTEKTGKSAAGLDEKMAGGIEILGLRDMEAEPPQVPEDGKTPLENARQKAHAYYRIYGMPVFSYDSGLYFENLPKEVQPGVHVRTVGGKYLTDEEVITYYTGLAKKYGDIKAYYQHAVCLVMGEGRVYEVMDESTASEPFLITSVPCSAVLHKGFPLDSISKDIRTGKYFYDVDESVRDQAAVQDGVVEFFRRVMAELR